MKPNLGEILQKGGREREGWKKAALFGVQGKSGTGTCQLSLPGSRVHAIAGSCDVAHCFVFLGTTELQTNLLDTLKFPFI